MKVKARDIPLTSAPAEKKRPSPVRTVKVVSGWSLSILRASMVSGIIFPPNALSDLGRLNCLTLAIIRHR